MCSLLETTSSTWKTAKLHHRRLPRAETQGSHMDRCGGVTQQAGSRFLGKAEERMLIASEITCFMPIFIFYSLIQIQ